MDQNQWFNTGSPAPMNDRQAFEAGWTAAQRQMAYSPQVPQINERIFQQTPQQAPPPRPTYLPGRVVNSPDDIRASEIPMDGTVAVFPASDYSYVVLKAWNSNGSIQTEIYQHVNPNAEKQEDPKFAEFKMAIDERLDKFEKILTSSQSATKSDSDRMEMSTNAQLHMGQTIATLREMWHDADPDLKQKMKKDFTALLQEMN